MTPETILGQEVEVDRSGEQMILGLVIGIGLAIAGGWTIRFALIG